MDGIASVRETGQIAAAKIEGGRATIKNQDMSSVAYNFDRRFLTAPFHEPPSLA